MVICYKKLWKLLIDRDLTKRELCKIAGVSTAAIAKMGKGENMNTDTLLKISNSLGVNITDIMESISESEAKSIT